MPPAGLATTSRLASSSAPISAAFPLSTLNILCYITTETALT